MFNIVSYRNLAVIDINTLLYYIGAKNTQRSSVRGLPMLNVTRWPKVLV